CTVDTCDGLGGCLHNPVSNGTACSDGNPCNGAETCQAGACAAGTPLVCNDGNPCTGDSCNPAAGCQFVVLSNGTTCSDGNACNGVETCQNGSCTAGTPPDCNDGNACTADSCNTVQGGQHAAGSDSTPCHAATVCNGVETCQAGRCTSGTPSNCDDGNPCTTDSCDPVLGCRHTAVVNGTSCSDGNLCNGAETCQAGTCTSGTAPNCDD